MLPCTFLDIGRVLAEVDYVMAFLKGAVDGLTVSELIVTLCPLPHAVEGALETE
jgi:hypothetical protein